MENTKIQQLQKGDIVSETQYYQVQNVGITGVHLINERKSPLSIARDIMEEATFTAGQFDTTKELTQTQLAELLSNTGDTVFEVGFYKQPNADHVAETIQNLNRGKFPTTGEIAHKVDEAYKGEMRVLRGYLLNIEALMGRAKVVDLDVRFDATEDKGYRLVDLRTIKYIIFKGVRYILKK